MKTIHDSIEKVEIGTEGVEITLTDLRTGKATAVVVEGEFFVSTILGIETSSYLN